MLKDSAVEAQPLRQLFGDERPAQQAYAGAAKLGRDVEPIEAGVTQGSVVLDGVACLPIVLGCAGGEVGGQAPGAVLQIPLRRRDVKLHSELSHYPRVSVNPRAFAIIRGGRSGRR